MFTARQRRPPAPRSSRARFVTMSRTRENVIFCSVPRRYCDREDCAADPDITNIDGDNSACENTNSGSTCAFTCATGYTASGVATCTAGAWDTPTCDAVCRTNLTTQFSIMQAELILGFPFARIFISPSGDILV